VTCFACGKPSHKSFEFPDQKTVVTPARAPALGGRPPQATPPSAADRGRLPRPRSVACERIKSPPRVYCLSPGTPTLHMTCTRASSCARARPCVGARIWTPWATPTSPSSTLRQPPRRAWPQPRRAGFPLQGCTFLALVNQKDLTNLAVGCVAWPPRDLIAGELCSDRRSSGALHRTPGDRIQNPVRFPSTHAGPHISLATDDPPDLVRSANPSL
jgi:hypothetical protein